MSQDRKKIPVRLKKKLIAQAGNKCANPGCPTRRIEYHHIKEWAVYLTHDERHMIAICPTCHDAVHNGELEINDDTIYGWKGIDRKPTNRDQIYVEPGGTPTLLLGRSTYNTGEDVVIFELKANNKLGFRLIDSDFFVVNLVITDRTDKELIRITENHIRLNVEEPARYERVPGHIRLSVPATSDYLPEGVLTYLKRTEPSFILNGRMPMLDLEVIEPSKVRIKGLWIKDEYSYDDGLIIFWTLAIFRER